ncbi:MAG: hypothetical protein IGS23_23705 [Rivularia sp. T60_A2020_040]|nr:hypothetical protein [Rivularia sp. T60_A2020_040]
MDDALQLKTPKPKLYQQLSGKVPLRQKLYVLSHQEPVNRAAYQLSTTLKLTCPCRTAATKLDLVCRLSLLIKWKA